MAVYDYILNGWENKELWVLNNAIWENNHLKINGNSGFAEREVANTYNKNWELKIYNCAKSAGLGVLGVNFHIFLQDDPNPIIFRRQQSGYDHSPRNRIWYIIYDGIIRDQIMYDGGAYWLGCDFFYRDEIRKIGSVYYYEPIEGFILSFDYGSIKKPVKLKLMNLENSEYSKWHYPLWYYTEPISEITEDYAFIM